jgi:hypothetical protein
MHDPGPHPESPSGTVSLTSSGAYDGTCLQETQAMACQQDVAGKRENKRVKVSQ